MNVHPEGGRIAPGSFTVDCRRCPRLAEFLQDSRQRFPGYFCRPVPSWGPAEAALLIVGLAPGLHGANATGRPFTGDFAGILLYETLHEFGFSSGPRSRAADDNLLLHNCRITNAVRCVPPQNKPTLDEIKLCNDYLREELAMLPQQGVVLALGGIAHAAVLRARGLRPAGHRFAHGAVHPLGTGQVMIDSYHCSRYNTQTGRLTPAMFRNVVGRARELLSPEVID